MGRWTELALKVAGAKKGVTTAAPEAGGSVNPVKGSADRSADVAMLELAPFITQTARRVHAGRYALRRQAAADFVAQAPALVWNKIENFEAWYFRELPDAVRADPAKDWFAAWCYTELNYRYLDFGRSQASEEKSRHQALGGWVADPTTAGPAADDEDGEEFELAPQDVQRIRAWDPMDAVILFCLAEQWDKVPRPVWKGWMDALGLEDPFPPAEYIQAPRLKKRGVLAVALGVSPDVIYQRWLRLKRKFQGQVNSA